MTRPSAPSQLRTPASNWRRAVLLSLPMAAFAFALGALLDGPSGQSTPFDRVSYPVLTGCILLLELLFWRLPQATNRLITALVVSTSVFFLGKLVYILNLMPTGHSVQVELTETFFWVPALYVLSFFVPNLRLARLVSGLFFVGMALVSLVYLVQHGLNAASLGASFALLELNLANLTLLALSNAFIGFKEHVVRAQAQSETLQRLAYADLLTGLPNRLHIDRVLDQRTDEDLPFSLLYIDMDGFKVVNDTLGHAAGDAVLREISARLTEHLGPDDLAVRLSGDEFMLVLPCGPDAAVVSAQQVLLALTRPFLVQGQLFHLTASIGVSSYPDDAREAITLLRHADSAMYTIKSSTKNGVQRFEPNLNTEIERQKTLTRELQFALERGEFSLVYQPIYALGSGELHKAETLLRWTHPTFGSVTPDVFIPLAEASTQILAIGQWVLEQACRQAQTWHRPGGVPPIVTVNVSPVQFAQSGFVASVRHALQQSGLPATRLELELTEGAVMRNLPAVQQALHDLQRLGVRVAIDDFGTGYSSLSYLKDLPITCIKIDRSFTADLASPRRTPQYALALVEAMVGIARTLDLEVVAEGIETTAQHQLLTTLGCGFGQGYLYARPLVPAALLALIHGEGQRPREDGGGSGPAQPVTDRAAAAADPDDERRGSTQTIAPPRLALIN
jgi:diguanylate cyclase